jgi:hypothetical protein
MNKSSNPPKNPYSNLPENPIEKLKWLFQTEALVVSHPGVLTEEEAKELLDAIENSYIDKDETFVFKKKKGEGWHGDRLRHSIAARKGWKKGTT